MVHRNYVAIVAGYEDQKWEFGKANWKDRGFQEQWELHIVDCAGKGAETNRRVVPSLAKMWVPTTLRSALKLMVPIQESTVRGSSGKR